MREKYVEGYLALSRLLVSDFLLSNVLFWSSIKKFKVPGTQILESWVPGPGSQVLGPVTQVSGPGSWVLTLDYARFYYYFEQIDVGWKIIDVVLILDNSFGVWRDRRKRA